MLEVLQFISTTLVIILMLAQVVEWYIKARKYYELHRKHTSRNIDSKRDDSDRIDD